MAGCLWCGGSWKHLKQLRFHLQEFGRILPALDFVSIWERNLDHIYLHPPSPLPSFFLPLFLFLSPSLLSLLNTVAFTQSVGRLMHRWLDTSCLRYCCLGLAKKFPDCCNHQFPGLMGVEKSWESDLIASVWACGGVCNYMKPLGVLLG